MSDRTLLFLLRGYPPREVLLGLKKVGFGAGKVAGFGGSVEPGESVEAAAIRELEEETGIRVSIHDIIPLGSLDFQFPFNPTWSQVVHVFAARTWAGEAIESDEMIPMWYELNHIPFDAMWDDATYWMPLILDGKRIKASFVFNEDNATVGKAVMDVLN